MHEDHEPDQDQPSLFDEQDALRRRRLVQRGWSQVGGYIGGRMCWRSPDGRAIFDELEAFRLLKREEEESDAGH